jgi:multisubunit Na+/H+ antiporter MnhG subunit
VGATLGLLAGAIGKLACCLAMIGLFTVNVVYRSIHPTG